MYLSDRYFTTFKLVYLSGQFRENICCSAAAGTGSLLSDGTSLRCAHLPTAIPPRPVNMYANRAVSCSMVPRGGAVQDMRSGQTHVVVLRGVSAAAEGGAAAAVSQLKCGVATRERYTSSSISTRSDKKSPGRNNHYSNKFMHKADKSAVSSSGHVGDAGICAYAILVRAILVIVHSVRRSTDGTPPRDSVDASVRQGHCYARHSP